MFFLRKFAQYPSSLIFIHPPALSYIDSKQRKQINSRKFANCGFRSVVVITSASHAEGRQFNSGRKQERFIFFILFSFTFISNYFILHYFFLSQMSYLRGVLEQKVR